jgi:hypothetical protein
MLVNKKRNSSQDLPWYIQFRLCCHSISTSWFRNINLISFRFLGLCSDTIQTVAQIVVICFQILRFFADWDSCDILNNIENKIMPVTIRLQVKLLEQLRLINRNAFFPFRHHNSYICSLITLSPSGVIPCKENQSVYGAKI